MDVDEEPDIPASQLITWKPSQSTWGPLKQLLAEAGNHVPRVEHNSMLTNVQNSLPPEPMSAGPSKQRFCLSRTKTLASSEESVQQPTPSQEDLERMIRTTSRNVRNRAEDKSRHLFERGLVAVAEGPPAKRARTAVSVMTTSTRQKFRMDASTASTSFRNNLLSEPSLTYSKQPVLSTTIPSSRNASAVASSSTEAITGGKGAHPNDKQPRSIMGPPPQPSPDINQVDQQNIDYAQPAARPSTSTSTGSNVKPFIFGDPSRAGPILPRTSQPSIPRSTPPVLGMRRAHTYGGASSTLTTSTTTLPSRRKGFKTPFARNPTTTSGSSSKPSQPPLPPAVVNSKYIRSNASTSAGSGTTTTSGSNSRLSSCSSSGGRGREEPRHSSSPPPADADSSYGEFLPFELDEDEERFLRECEEQNSKF
ncbi:hypothetical protein C8Q75DRAFT_747781 [Abortiporus biennis]|nr:hypothetical protein C8Q75DRAFT_747781 [Abortiporus biennis]